MAEEDPWLDLESEVDAAMRQLQAARDQYREHAERVGSSSKGDPPVAVGGGSSSTNNRDWSHVSPTAAAQLDQLLSTLAGHINALEPDIDMLGAGVTAAHEHPERYDVATAELQRRSDVVQIALRKLAVAKADVTHGMKARERRIAAQKAIEQAKSNGSGERHAGVDAYMEQEYEEQRDVRATQDKALDRIGAGLQTAEEKALAINRELEEQDKIIEEIENDTGALQHKIDNSMRRIDNLLERTSDKGKIITIVVLMVVLAILVVFLFSGSDSSASAT